MLPNWIIAGAPKSGTTSLFQWLADHPEAGASRAKETCYFLDPGSRMFDPRSNFPAGGLAGYEALFAHCGPASKVVIESTPGYLYARTALRELPRLPSRPSFIFVLREPVDQIKSLFSYFQNNWAWIPPHVTFRSFVAELDRGTGAFDGNELARDALENANYVVHLRRWLEACGRERIHVFLFEDMVSRKREFMMELAAIMGIDPGFYEDYRYPSENGSYAVRNHFLQSINLKLRPVLPKGSAYEALRRLYRALNTRPAPGSRILDLEIERELSRRYAAASRELAREFGVDITVWEKRAAARFGQPAQTASSALPAGSQGAI